MRVINAASLEKHGPCDEGLAAFLRAYPAGVDVSHWTILDQMMLLAHQGVRPFWGWAVEKGLIPSWSMSGAILSGADLSGADLDGADLSGADLAFADLSQSQLSGTCFRDASLHEARLDGAAWDAGTVWPEGFDPLQHGAESMRPKMPQ